MYDLSICATLYMSELVINTDITCLQNRTCQLISWVIPAVNISAKAASRYYVAQVQRTPLEPQHDTSWTFVECNSCDRNDVVPTPHIIIQRNGLSGWWSAPALFLFRLDTYCVPQQHLTFTFLLLLRRKKLLHASLKLCLYYDVILRVSVL